MENSTIVKFSNADVIPPRGGWHYVIQGETVNKFSESEIIEAIRRFRKNNGTYTSDADIEREIWTYYCNREPKRCGAPVSVQGSLTAQPAGQLELTPEIYGPWIWKFLNFAAARWTPESHDWFLSLCDQIIVLLDCPLCRQEWRTILAEHSPAGIATRLQCCQWVNKAHNIVNDRKGKDRYPYERGVAEYGWPTS